MTPENQKERRAQIELAAFTVLAKKGYRRTSMLQIAKQAKASNETLYAWYGSKEQLFTTIIKDNGLMVRSYLEGVLKDKTDPRIALETLGPLLLQFTTSENAIIINRAAVTDVSETGLLAVAIDKAARGVIYPLICSLMEALEQSGHFTLDAGVEDAANNYIALLLGETQFRQALGRIGPLSEKDLTRQAARAFALTEKLYRAQ